MAAPSTAQHIDEQVVLHSAGPNDIAQSTIKPRVTTGWAFRPPYQLPWRAAFIVFLLALLSRLIFVTGVVEVTSETGIWILYGDSPEYLRTANNLAHAGTYSREGMRPQIEVMVRTPLYPLLIAGWVAATDLLGLTPKWAYSLTFYTQAFLDAGHCSLAGVLAWMLWRQRWLVWIVGLAMAASMTGIGLTAVIMTDGPFALAIAAATALTLWAASQRSAGLAVLAGLAWAAATFIKPTTTLWPIALPAVWVLASVGWEVSWKRSLVNLVICLVVFVSPLLGWAAYQKAARDVFAFSIVSERNLRYMVAPRIDQLRETGTVDMDRFWRDYYATGVEDRALMEDPETTPRTFVEHQRAAIKEQVLDHPRWLLATMATYFEWNMIASWDILHRQLPPEGTVPEGAKPFGPPSELTQPLRDLFFPLIWLDEQKETRWTTFILAITAVGAGWVAVLMPNAGRRERLRWAGRATAVLLVAAYLVATASTSFEQGSRLLYPAYAPALALAGGWLALLLPPYRIDESALAGGESAEGE